MTGGSDHRRRIASLCAAGFAGLVSCAPLSPATQHQLLKRAAFDLRCPTAELQIYRLDGRTRGVFGCNRQLVYVETCDARRQPACIWTVDAPPVKGTTVQHLYQPTVVSSGQAPAAVPDPAELYRLDDE